MIQGRMDVKKHTVFIISLIGLLFCLIPDSGQAKPPEPVPREFTTVLKPTESSPWSLSLHAGMNDPTGSFGNSYDSGTSLGLDVEYLFDPQYAMELFLGFDDFDGIGGIQDIDITHLSVNAKRYSTNGMHRYFVQGGIGSYHIDSVGTDVGFNVGAGFQWNHNPYLAYELTVKYHSIDTSGDSSQFHTLHVGVRYRY